MSRHLCAAMAIAMLAVASPLAPALAGERATLRVTAQVVDRCTFEVPSHVSPRLWHAGEREPWRFVRQTCQGKPPFWLHAKKILLEDLRDRYAAYLAGRDARVREVRHPSRRDVVLITITY